MPSKYKQEFSRKQSKKNRSPVDRIMDKIEIDPITGCWNFTGSLSRGGYGAVYTRERGVRTSLLAHRAMWANENGPIPDGLFILHSCNNPRCCNPQHLRAGTPADNGNDIAKRNRMPQGARHGSSVLSESEALGIRQMFDQGVPIKTIARKYQVSRNAVRSIGKRETWKTLPDLAIDGVVPLIPEVVRSRNRPPQFEPRHAARRDCYP